MKRNRLKNSVFIVFGSLITAIGIAAFITPAKIASGGVSGIAVILYHTFGFEVGTTIFVLSVPLFLAGMKIFGHKYGISSLLGTVLFSLFVTAFGLLFGFEGFLPYTDSVDTLLSALFGGLMTGFGMGLVLRGGANTGGTDIAAQILSNYTPVPVGTSLFVIDALIVITGGFVFGLKNALFAVLSLYTTSVAINFVLLGMGTRYAKTAFIISENHEAIANRITGELGHGGTLINATGIYTKKERPVLMTVIPNNKVSKLNALVKETDPKAFMIIEEAYEVIGEGFSSIEE